MWKQSNYNSLKKELQVLNVNTALNGFTATGTKELKRRSNVLQANETFR